MALINSHENNWFYTDPTIPKVKDEQKGQNNVLIFGDYYYSPMNFNGLANEDFYAMGMTTGCPPSETTTSTPIGPYCGKFEEIESPTYDMTPPAEHCTEPAGTTCSNVAFKGSREKWNKIPILSPDAKACRRRKQNRESQRAFRQRKERYIKTLESELENLRKNHKNLQEACQKQKEAMSRLRVEVLVLRQNII